MNKQIIFLDFNGALTSFRNELLTVENVMVSDSMLTTADVDFIINKLNSIFENEQIFFTADEPQNETYSTIFVGKTDAFIQYGAFRGLAETVDTNNQLQDDNAFVNMDSTSSLEEIIETIIHETAHLIGSMDHGGDALERYAHLEQLTGTISSAKINPGNDFNCTVDCGLYNTANNVTVTSNLSVSNGGTAYNVTICNDAKLTVLNGGYVENVTVIGSGSYLDNAQMLVYKGSTVKDVTLAGGELLITDNGCKLTGELVLGGTKGGVNGSLMLSVKDDNIHDYVDPDWSDLNIVFDITSMNPAYLKASAGGMDVYFSETRSIETPISYVDPANFIIRVSSGAEGGYYWLTNAEIDMTTYKPITFTKDVIFELDGENIGTFKWNKSKKAYELKTNSGYKASDYKDYQLYSNSMPTSITAHNLPGVVFTCKSPDPVLLYSGNDDLLASQVKFSGKMNTAVNGQEVKKIVAGKSGTISDITMFNGCELTLNAGVKFTGNNTIAGTVTVKGALANGSKENISLTFDIAQCDAQQQGAILSGYQFIKNNVSQLTISVSGKEPKDEAEYILIDNIGNLPGKELQKITFTVDGKVLNEEYEGQYTFTWDENQKKYTGINYNGYNYTLSTENNKMTLSVNKNEHTLLLYLDGDDTPKDGATIAKKMNDITQVLTDLSKAQGTGALSNNMCILVYADAFEPTYGKDGVYSIVGSGALSFEKKDELYTCSGNELQSLLTDGNKYFGAADYSLVVWNHGGGIYGLCYDDNDSSVLNQHMSINGFAEALTNSGCAVSNICFDTCLMSSLEFMALLNKNPNLKNVVASAEITFTESFDYKNVIESISKAPDNDTGKELFDSFSKRFFTISSVEVQGIGQVLRALDLTAKYLLSEIKDDSTWIDIVKAANGALAYNSAKRYSADYVSSDLGSFLNNISKHLPAGSLAKSAAAVTLDYLDKVVQLKSDSKKYTYSGSSGISIHIPTAQTGAYDVIRSSMPENWVKLLDKIMEYDKYVDKSISVIDKFFNRDAQGTAQLGAFNGNGTSFVDVVVNNYYSSDFSFVLTGKGQKNDSIIIESPAADDSFKWELYSSSQTKIKSGSFGEAIQLNGLSKGEYKIKLVAPDEITADIKFNADWSAGDDHIDYYQSNDNMADATELSPFALTGLSVDGDDIDWFKFDAANSANKITISDPVSIEGLTISLFDENGNFVEFLTPEKDTPDQLTYSSAAGGYLAIQSSDQLRHSYSIVSEFRNTVIDNLGSDFQHQFSTQVQQKDKYVLGDVYLASGKFQISGNFSNLSGKLSLLDSKGKTVNNFSIKNGTLKENNSLLSGDKYTLVFTLTSKLSQNVDLSVDITGKVFVQADNSDDWLDVKYAGPRGSVAPADKLKEDQQVFVQNWVGFGDEIDYKMFDLDTAAKISFTVEGTDASKFALYSLTKKVDKKGNVSYSLKTLQNNTLKLDKTSGKYIVETKDLLLENGTYYFSMTSTNAKKGGDCNYTVTVNDDSVFFTHGDDNSNDWLYDKKSGIINDAVGSIGQDTAIALDDWVGFGDAVDYHSFELTSSARLSFEVSADDASKFAIYQLQESIDKKGNVSYSLKTLQNNTLKLDKASGKYIVDTKDLLLTSGTYYVSMTSSNAKKGASCSYSIAVSEDSEAFPAELVSNNTTREAVDLSSSDAPGVVKAWDGNSAVFENWVGFGDAVDYVMFELEQNEKIDIDLKTEDGSLRQGKDIKVKLLNENGKALSLTGDMFSKTALSSGTYYVMVEIANEKKYQSEYTLQITSL